MSESGARAYANPRESSDNVIFYSSGAAPAGKELITCGLSGNTLDNLQCLSGSNLYNGFNPDTQTPLWQMTNNYQGNLFSIYVTPIVE